jgi:hypothetical protein
MGDPGMVLREEDVRRIGDYVKPWLRDLVSEFVPLRSTDVSSQLLERIVRVEEELKSQRELFAGRFSAMDQRFTDLQTYMDRRFSSLQWTMMIGFTIITAAVTVFGLMA